MGFPPQRQLGGWVMRKSEVADLSAKSIFGDLAIWLKIGFLSFGGPAAQIALMHREIVEKRRWLSEQQYLNALSFCLLLPGPEAMQLATYVGWRRTGLAGGLLAGLIFIGPGALIILALAIIYIFFGQNLFLASLFSGIKAAVIVIVLHSLLRIARRTMTDIGDWSVATLAFIGIFFLDLPFPLILLAAAIFGLFGKVRSEKGTAKEQANTVEPSATRTLVTVVIGLAIWLLPLLGIALLAGRTVLPELAQFSSKLSVVAFGGAYAALAYMGQEVVNHHHWLSTPEMMDGLGLAETTPGPLILVTEFVGFIAAYRDALSASGGTAISTSPVIFGCVGALVTLWATFAPCFLWIFSAGPYVEWIVARPRLNNALGGITAAVVGVIGNLSVWFALHVFFADVNLVKRGMFQILIPNLSSAEWGVLSIAFACGILLFWRQWDSWRIIAIAAALGLGMNNF